MVNSWSSTTRRFIWPFAAWLFTCCFSGGSNAEDFFWRVHGANTDINQRYPSAEAACQAWSDYWGYTYRSKSPTNSPVTSTTVAFRCTATSSNGRDSFGTIYRLGTACPAGTSYNAGAGVCEPPAPDVCEATIGRNLSHEHRMGEYTGGGAIGARLDPPGVVCQGSCQYAWNGSGPSNVYRFMDGTPNGVFGLFSYRGNGVSCSSEDAPNQGPSSLDAQSKSESSCTDKVTDGEGRVHMTCQTSSEYTNPGSCDLGQVNGETVCIPNSPSPSQQKTETETEVTEVTNPDGSKTTTTSETTTTTNCSGTRACTTNVTNNTSVSNTNADGSKGSESSTCTGPGCKDGNGKSQSDRDREGEEKEEEEEKESSASGLQCTQAIACEGELA